MVGDLLEILQFLKHFFKLDKHYQLTEEGPGTA